MEQALVVEEQQLLCASDVLDEQVVLMLVLLTWSKMVALHMSQQVSLLWLWLMAWWMW
jgi:hypothetical protein